MSVRAVLFDFDGVIADTENIHIVAWQHTLGRMGWLIPDQVAAKAAEVDDRLWLQALFASKKIKEADIEGWCRRKQELTIRMLKESPPIYPGLAALVERLRGKVRLGVVSTTWRENVTSTLEAAKLSDAFEFVVGKEDVEEVKPDPEAYRLALRKLGMPGSEVIAIEDSPGGLAAAVGAQLRILAVGHRRPQGDWHSEAIAFVPHFRDTELVERLLLPTN
jgi:HAD superfamily hydrolase (TIGR01509 family)